MFAVGRFSDVGILSTLAVYYRFAYIEKTPLLALCFFMQFSTLLQGKA